MKIGRHKAVTRKQRGQALCESTVFAELLRFAAVTAYEKHWEFRSQKSPEAGPQGWTNSGHRLDGAAGDQEGGPEAAIHSGRDSALGSHPCVALLSGLSQRYFPNLANRPRSAAMAKRRMYEPPILRPCGATPLHIATNTARDGRANVAGRLRRAPKAAMALAVGRQRGTQCGRVLEYLLCRRPHHRRK